MGSHEGVVRESIRTVDLNFVEVNESTSTILTGENVKNAFSKICDFYGNRIPEKIAYRIYGFKIQNFDGNFDTPARVGSAPIARRSGFWRASTLYRRAIDALPTRSGVSIFPLYFH